MTLQQAKESLKYGAKITHPLWENRDYITHHWRTGYLTNQSDRLIQAVVFWNDMQSLEAFQNGWELYIPTCPVTQLMNQLFK
jgi:hypothetical protein